MPQEHLSRVFKVFLHGPRKLRMDHSIGLHIVITGKLLMENCGQRICLHTPLTKHEGLSDLYI